MAALLLGAVALGRQRVSTATASSAPRIDDSGSGVEIGGASGAPAPATSSRAPAASVPSVDDVLATIAATLDHGRPSPVTAAMARAHPDIVLGHYVPILLDHRRETRERYDAFVVVVALAEVQDARARDALVALAGQVDAPLQLDRYAVRELARCFGNREEVRQVLRENSRVYAAFLGDVAAARRVMECALVARETRELLDAAGQGDWERAGLALLSGQAGGGTRRTDVERLTAVLLLGRRELVPYLRRYAEGEKARIKRERFGQFEDYDWEQHFWSVSEFLGDRPLYEAVRVLHALDGELTDREREYLSRLGMVGERPRACSE